MLPKTRSFFFHFNKPASAKAKKPQISLHYHGACYIVDNIICNVPTRGHVRKSQPVFIMVGKCRSIVVENNIATLE